ncbi:ThiF family adenylyltransferase [Cohnella caldifontis]|uniref:ThiF family adenylyltransferase n=1 Tax=Cohnella caldifontis TaxID=3027471 RepID=UPI0023EDDD1D|nr:ThiF family adenylyltransferase [Cohnella sp. YIM B05605]
MLDAGGWETRYSRQIRFAPIGTDGQRRLGESAVLVAGVGALGASLAQHMARAGVGTIRLVDRDYVEPSNLQRQALFDEADARDALPKAVAAANKLRNVNGGIRIEARVADLDSGNADSFVRGADLVLDGTDNAETRLILSDVCYARGIPLVYGGVAGSEGMTAALVPGETACLRCLIGGDAVDASADRTCDAVGVIAPAVEAVAALQAAEALKWLSGNRGEMRRSWIGLDVWSFAVRESKLPAPRTECECCGRAGRQVRQVAAKAREGISAALLCGRDTVQVTLADPLPLAEVKARLERSGAELLAANGWLLKWSVPEGERIVLFEGGRALVQGTGDEEHAIRLCLKYVQEGREPACAG